MNEQTKIIYKKLKAMKSGSKKTTNILLIISAVALIITIIAASAKINSVMMAGILVFSFSIFIILIRLAANGDASISLKKSLKTLEKTGNIKYIDEIIDNNFTTVDKTCFSQHLFYVKGKVVIAYEDITNVSRINNNYYIDTVDNARHRTYFSKAVLTELKNRCEG